MGGADKVKRQHDGGRLTVRERIDGLLDPGTGFLEIAQLAAWGLYDGGVPAAGVVAVGCAAYLSTPMTRSPTTTITASPTRVKSQRPQGRRLSA
jgi:hypothetical protein